MEVLIGLAAAIIGIETIVLILIAIRGRRQRRKARLASSHESGVLVDEAAWAGIVKRLKKDRAWEEPDGNSRAGGQR